MRNFFFALLLSLSHEAVTAEIRGIEFQLV